MLFMLRSSPQGACLSVTVRRGCPHQRGVVEMPWGPGVLWLRCGCVAVSTETCGVVEIGAEAASQAAWSAQVGAVGLEQGVHAEGAPRPA